jgi:hypothetical protein
VQDPSRDHERMFAQAGSTASRRRRTEGERRMPLRLSVPLNGERKLIT